MKRSFVLSLALAGGCSAQASEISPRTVSQQGGEVIEVRADAAPKLGGVVVLVDGVPANSVVVAAPNCIHARLPSLPRSGEVDVELLFADGSSRVVNGLEVTPPKLDVRDLEEP